MARIENIAFKNLYISVVSAEVLYADSASKVNMKLPQIFWSSGQPWREANIWAMRRVMEGESKIRTVDTCMAALLCYANYLENFELSWFSFPVQRRERCIVQYRGWLISERDSGKLAPSTTSEYMRVAIAFYRWAYSEKLLEKNISLWREKSNYFTIYSHSDFERTITVISTELRIPNRQRPGIKLEDGLLPVSAADRDAILSFCEMKSSKELYLMLCLGFFTGLRIGTICDLKIDSLHNAVEDPQAVGLRRLVVGPGASPPVRTKFDVTGAVWIPQALLDICIEYGSSLRRSRRQAKASFENRGLLFLNRFGKPYCRRESTKSTSVNEEMSRLRKIARDCNFVALYSFHFHQSRCTFATELSMIASTALGEINAIAVVREALLHANERDAFAYIKYARAAPVKQEMANEFSRYFLGVRFGFQNT